MHLDVFVFSQLQNFNTNIFYANTVKQLWQTNTFTTFPTPADRFTERLQNKVVHLTAKAPMIISV